MPNDESREDDDDDEDEPLEIGLGVMEWAEVCAALKHYVQTACKGAPASRADACRILQRIDQAMTGADEPAPLDDLLGAGED